MLLSEVMDEFLIRALDQFLIAKIRALDLFSIVVVIFSHTHCKPSLFVFHFTSLTPFSIGVSLDKTFENGCLNPRQYLITNL